MTTDVHEKRSLCYITPSLDGSNSIIYRKPRFYSPAVGRFTELDDFAGDINFPQSLHKYTYCHDDPINGVDPSGQFVVGFMLSFFSSMWLREKDAIASSSALALAGRVALFTSFGYLAAAFSYSGWASLGYPNLKPFGSEIHKAVTDMDDTDWASCEKNVYNGLMIKVNDGDSAAEAGARRLAKTYVEIVRQHNEGGPGGWWQSVAGPGPNCEKYANLLFGPLLSAAQNSGWIIRKHEDVQKGGYPQFHPLYVENVACVPLHSFVSATYKGRSQNGKISTPDWIFDPWACNKPYIYAYSKFREVWSIPNVDDNL